VETIHPKHARHPFTYFRDEAGVPHIEAATWHEALYGLGYLHALDRPTQVLFGRTLANGRAAERISDTPHLLETDRFFRRAALYRHLGREVPALDERILEQVVFYCDGLNDALRNSGRSLPMWATGFHPEPWNPEAVLLIGNLLSFGGLAVGQQQNERLLLELIQLGIEPRRLRELFSPALDNVDFDLLRNVKTSSRLSDEALELITDLPRLAGSNAWAVSPQRSASGAALLSADPHLEINRLPAIWYEACLRWNGNYVIGATLPGCPLFAVARTRDLAWGVTYLKGDTSDYFIEDCRREGDAWQYRRGEAWHNFAVREEHIERKGSEAETLRIYENELGTLETDLDAQGPGLHLSVRWIGNADGASRSIGTWLDLIAADSVKAGMAIVRQCSQPSLVWVFADRKGHIGRQAGGWFPRRREGHLGLTPVAAWDESNRWQGHWPGSELPGDYDPPEGFIASANENINPPGGPPFITVPLPDYRKRRIDERLAQLPQATLEDMQRLQYDVISTQARDLLPIFLPHMPAGPQKQRLAVWDYSYAPDSTEATLFQRLYRNVLLEIFGHEQGIGWRRMLYLCTRAGYSAMVLAAIDRVLKKEKSSWWSERDKGELIRRAAERLTDEQDEPWSAVNSFHFVNRYFEGRRVGHVLGFHSDAIAMPGCHATPFQGHLLMTATRESTFAPSYHFVADLSTDEAWTNLPGGPSESRFSKYYRSDIPRWIAGDYKQLAWPEAEDAAQPVE
jgi:penicillin amidase